jgi:glycosyltransferase involved in cell wall biosynthesis
MKIVHLSYAQVNQYNNPEEWLKKINYYVLLLEEMGAMANVQSVHCINYTGVIAKKNATYHFIKLSRLQLLFPFLLNKYVKQLNPHVVIVHGFHFPFKILLLRWQLGSDVKIVLQNHAERPLRHYKKVIQKLIDGFISAYFFTSLDQAKPWLEKKQIADAKKIFEVMEVPSVFYRMDRTEARTRSKISTLKSYLWVGRLEANKDPITLVKAFSIFAKSNPAVHLYVVFQSDELLEEVKNIISEADQSAKQITLVGKIEHDELLYWYNSVDFIVSTSHYEGSGIAVCEGMSCGCIPILTNIASFRMMTAEGTCGQLYKAGDVNSLNSALQKSLLINVEQERAKVLKQYQENLSAKAIAKKMMRVLENL